MTGRFVVLEGLDGAGTTTQSAELTLRLERAGLSVLRTAEPTTGPVGRLIRATLSRAPQAPDPETLPWLFAADRSDHLAGTIEPALAAGTWVVSDRYLPSSLAYQSLEHPMELVDSLNRWFRLPDVTVYLDVPVEVCVTRIQARGGEREIFEERALLERVAASYRTVNGTLRGRGAQIIDVDGLGSVDEVADRIWRVVAP